MLKLLGGILREALGYLKVVRGIPQTLFTSSTAVGEEVRPEGVRLREVLKVVRKITVDLMVIGKNIIARVHMHTNIASLAEELAGLSLASNNVSTHT